MAAAPTFAFAASADQSRLRFMEREAVRQDRIVTSVQHCDQAGLQRHASLPREVGRVAGAAQQALHPAPLIWHSIGCADGTLASFAQSSFSISTSAFNPSNSQHPAAVYLLFLRNIMLILPLLLAGPRFRPYLAGAGD